MPDWLPRLQSFGGLILMLFIAWLLSSARRRINLRVVLVGLGLQFVIALFVLKTGTGKAFFNGAKGLFTALFEASNSGAKFLFGNLVSDSSIGAQAAFQMLPTIIFVSALAGVLYHLGIVQFVVRILARLMQWTMRISGAEALASALMIFLGIESTTAIAVYIRKMTRSELFVLMASFMATIAASVMLAYQAFGADPGHLVTASVMSAPAAIVVAKIMLPETGEPLTRGYVKFRPERTSRNIFDAAVGGAIQGLKLAAYVGAVLIAFVGLIALLNLLLSWAFGISLQQILGYAMVPFAFAMGVPWEDAVSVGQLLGVKTVLNEWLAYSQLKPMIAAGKLSPRSVVIATYALCGFANFGSIAILIGGLGAIDPQRRGLVASLGLKALIAGTLAAFMTACFAGMLT